MPWNGQVSVKDSRSFCSVGQTSGEPDYQVYPRVLSSKVQGYPGGPQNPESIQRKIFFFPIEKRVN